MNFLCTEKAMYSRLQAINPGDHNETARRSNHSEVPANCEKMITGNICAGRRVVVAVTRAGLRG